MLNNISQGLVDQIIDMCDKHVAELPDELRHGYQDPSERNGFLSSHASKSITQFQSALAAMIGRLSKDGQIELLALYMFGRHPEEVRTFEEAISEARDEYDDGTAAFLSDKHLTLAGSLRSGLQQLKGRT